jgi:hypothetical protein
MLGATMASAELQSVQVGGEIQIRGRYWHNNYSRSFVGVGTPRYVGYNFATRLRPAQPL